MADLQVTTSMGGEAVLAEATVEEFKTGFRGQVLTSSDEGYDEAA